MASRYLLESGAPDGYLLEDGSGVLLLDLDPPYVVRATAEHSSSVADTAIITSNLTVVEGDLLIAYVKYESSSSQTVSMNDNGGSNDTWTEIESGYHDATIDAGVRVFYLSNATAGTSTPRAAFGASVDFPAIFAMAVGNMALAPFDDIVYQSQTTPGTGADAVSSSNLGVLTTQPQMILGISHEFGGATRMAPILGSGFTNIGDVFDYEGTTLDLAKVEHKRITSTSATAATFTAQGATHNFISVAVAFKEFATIDVVVVIPTINMAPMVSA